MQPKEFATMLTRSNRLLGSPSFFLNQGLKRTERKAVYFFSSTAKIDVPSTVYPLPFCCLLSLALGQISSHVVDMCCTQMYKTEKKTGSVTLSYGLDDRSSIPGRSKIFVLCYRLQSGPGVQPPYSPSCSRRFLGACEKLYEKRLLASSCLSVRRFARNNSVPTGWIIINIYI
jgi:hypothetical protein